MCLYVHASGRMLARVNALVHVHKIVCASFPNCVLEKTKVCQAPGSIGPATVMATMVLLKYDHGGCNLQVILALTFAVAAVMFIHARLRSSLKQLSVLQRCQVGATFMVRVADLSIGVLQVPSLCKLEQSSKNCRRNVNSISIGLLRGSGFRPFGTVAVI